MVQSGDGRLFLLTNHPQNNVLIFDQQGSVQDWWTLGLSGAHGLTWHREASGQEFLYITDTDGRIVKTTLDGKIALELAHPAKIGAYTDKDSYIPTETAIAPNGDIYVADGYGSQHVLSIGMMKPEEIERAFSATRTADVVVFGLFTRVRAYVEDAIKVAKPYRALIERTATAGRNFALLNFGNPYVMADLPKPAFSLCTFSDATGSITAAVEVLFGELKPQGQLPVRISERYPFGHGLKG
jgi:hypothetical protein